MSHQEWKKGRYTIATDPQRIDVEAVHAYLSRSYWAAEIPKEVVARSVSGSLCIARPDAYKQSP